jgi:hypothetical protein
VYLSIGGEYRSSCHRATIQRRSQRQGPFSPVLGRTAMHPAQFSHSMWVIDRASYRPVNFQTLRGNSVRTRPELNRAIKRLRLYRSFSCFSPFRPALPTLGCDAGSAGTGRADDGGRARAAADPPSPHPKTAGATLLHALFFFLGNHGPICEGICQCFYGMLTAVPQFGKIASPACAGRDREAARS